MIEKIKNWIFGSDESSDTNGSAGSLSMDDNGEITDETDSAVLFQHREDEFHKTEHGRTVWKATRSGLVRLYLPEGTTVYHGTGVPQKCRAERAFVTGMYGEQRTEYESIHNLRFVYRLGEEKTPEGRKFDLRNHDCAAGIHFFKSISEAFEWLMQCADVPSRRFSDYSPRKTHHLKRIFPHHVSITPTVAMEYTPHEIEVSAARSRVSLRDERHDEGPPVEWTEISDQ